MENIPVLEKHPLKPFLPQNARLLFLGSFPPPRRRWCIDFYYPNFGNDHWRIEGQVWYGDRNHFVDTEHKCFRKNDIVAFLKEKGIALYDTARVVRRLKGNASDAFLEIAEPTDIRALLKWMPLCKAIATTGEKATLEMCRALDVEIPPTVGHEVVTTDGLRLFRLPSSSRAYPLAFDKKCEAYKSVFEKVFGILSI
ncbi:MAG: uracil-DNA glycosylase family protein [Bacteroidales bacterium]|nr:uracil-DNA glycosylase family protein [Bacteroidales bacterium]